MQASLSIALAAAVLACTEGAGTAGKAVNVLTGLYVHGHEVESFHPCGDTVSYWVVPPAHRRDWLHARRDSLVQSPYAPVFIALTGSVSSKTTEGFAASYSAYFMVDSIIDVRGAQATDCRMGEFRR